MCLCLCLLYMRHGPSAQRRPFTTISHPALLPSTVLLKQTNSLAVPTRIPTMQVLRVCVCVPGSPDARADPQRLPACFFLRADNGIPRHPTAARDLSPQGASPSGEAIEPPASCRRVLAQELAQMSLPARRPVPAPGPPTLPSPLPARCAAHATGGRTVSGLTPHSRIFTEDVHTGVTVKRQGGGRSKQLELEGSGGEKGWNGTGMCRGGEDTSPRR
jgi:hypothetical protein